METVHNHKWCINHLSREYVLIHNPLSTSFISVSLNKDEIAKTERENSLSACPSRKSLQRLNFSTKCDKIYTSWSRKANLSNEVTFLKINRKLWSRGRLSGYFIQAVYFACPHPELVLLQFCNWQDP